MSEANDLVRLVEDSMKEADVHTAVGLYGYVSWEEVLEKRGGEWLARERARWQAEAWDEGAQTAWERSTPEVNGARYHWRSSGEPRNPYRESEDDR